MPNCTSAKVIESGSVVGWDVSYMGISHSLMAGETYEGGVKIKTAQDAESFVVGLVDTENERRRLRTEQS